MNEWENEKNVHHNAAICRNHHESTKYHLDALVAISQDRLLAHMFIIFRYIRGRDDAMPIPFRFSPDQLFVCVYLCVLCI